MTTLIMQAPTLIVIFLCVILSVFLHRHNQKKGLTVYKSASAPTLASLGIIAAVLLFLAIYLYEETEGASLAGWILVCFFLFPGLFIFELIFGWIIFKLQNFSTSKICIVTILILAIPVVIFQLFFTGRNFSQVTNEAISTNDPSACMKALGVVNSGKGGDDWDGYKKRCLLSAALNTGNIEFCNYLQSNFGNSGILETCTINVAFATRNIEYCKKTSYSYESCKNDVKNGEFLYKELCEPDTDYIQCMKQLGVLKDDYFWEPKCFEGFFVGALKKNDISFCEKGPQKPQEYIYYCTEAFEFSNKLQCEENENRYDCVKRVCGNTSTSVRHDCQSKVISK